MEREVERGVRKRTKEDYKPRYVLSAYLTPETKAKLEKLKAGHHASSLSHMVTVLVEEGFKEMERREIAKWTK